MPATDLNPFASEYTALDTQLREMLQEVEQMEAELEWLAGNSSESLSRAVRAVSDELAVAVREASGVDVLRRRIRSGRALLEMKKRKVPLDQAGILTLEQELEAEENKLESSDKLVVNKKLELERLHEAQHRLATGDPARLTARRDALKKKLISI